MCGKEDANTGIHHLPSTGHGTISISYILGRMAAQTNVQLHTYFIEMKYVAVCILYTMSQPILFYLQVLEDHEDDMQVSFMVKTGDLYYWSEPPDNLPYRQNKTLFVELILLNWSMKGHNFDSPKVTLHTLKSAWQTRRLWCISNRLTM